MIKNRSATVQEIAKYGRTNTNCEKSAGALYSRADRFWVLRKVKLCVVPLGAKRIKQNLKHDFDPKTSESYPF